ncbi:hypothetical protein D9V32_07250 [Mycetocola tolaasinivorans]|uniref:Uncharacterized protein n=1 Tax=Mycetocola tolaasinivorans TaxID=76635 RepID=A0A3L7A810_9MICO|nr:hypothetical protein D9V32_07250 [Mycetocola tolaasinivorans]
MLIVEDANFGIRHVQAQRSRHPHGDVLGDIRPREGVYAGFENMGGGVATSGVEPAAVVPGQGELPLGTTERESVANFPVFTPVGVIVSDLADAHRNRFVGGRRELGLGACGNVVGGELEGTGDVGSVDGE